MFTCRDTSPTTIYPPSVLNRIMPLWAELTRIKVCTACFLLQILLGEACAISWFSSGQEYAVIGISVSRIFHSRSRIATLVPDNRCYPYSHTFTSSRTAVARALDAHDVRSSLHLYIALAPSSALPAPYSLRPNFLPKSTDFPIPMARLVCPPTLSRFAASASTTAKPAAGRPISQRVSIQSVPSRSKTSAARSSLIHSAFPRTTLDAVPNAFQQTRSAPRVSAVTSRTHPAACIRALDVNTSSNKAKTNLEQKNVHPQTRIPGPGLTSTTQTKWSKVRQFVSLVYKTMAKNMNNKTHDDLPAAAQGLQEFEAESEDEDAVIEIDNNPDLLNDVSFDETIDRFQQSSVQSQLAKFELLGATIRQGGRTVKCPAYGGADSFILGRKRPRVPSPEVTSKKVVPSSKIPRMTKSTLKYGGKLLVCMRRWKGTNDTSSIDLTTAPSAFTVEQAKSEARFGYNKPRSQSKPDSVSFSMPSSSACSSTPDVVASGFERPLSPLPAPCRKVVHFQEDIVQPLMFDIQASANDLKSVLDADDELMPLKLDR
jgi:hypothetical protein